MWHVGFLDSYFWPSKAHQDDSLICIADLKTSNRYLLMCEHNNESLWIGWQTLINESYLILLDHCGFREHYHPMHLFRCNSLKRLINWRRLASVSSFFLFCSHLLIILYNVKLVALISIRVFFVLLFHIIVPDGMVARKIYIFLIVIR